GQFPSGPLTVLRRVAYILSVWADDLRKPLFQALDDSARIIHAERGLGNKSELFGVADLNPGDFFGCGDQMHSTADSAHRADDLRMAGMPDQDNFATLVGVALTFNVHFRDQRAGRIDYGKTALRRAILDGAGDTVRAENGDGAGWDFVDFIDETCAFRAQ